VKHTTLIFSVCLAFVLAGNSGAVRADNGPANKGKPQERAAKMERKADQSWRQERDRADDADERREQARERAEEAREAEEEARKEADERRERARESVADEGSEQSATVRARQEERQQIKQEYREATRSGEAEKVKGKKPWWKFWGDDAE
jgi:hypothetical protein